MFYFSYSACLLLMYNIIYLYFIYLFSILLIIYLTFSNSFHPCQIGAQGS